MPESKCPVLRRSRAGWQQLMTQYEASDVTQRTFCEQNGLSYATFGYWRKRLRQSPSVKNHVESLFELPILPIDKQHGWRVELDLGQGVVLRLK